MSIHYSTDEEVFSHDTLHEAVESLLADDETIKQGDVVSVFSGESEAVNIKSYIPDVMENMGEMSYDDMGEFADSWPDAPKNVEKEIQNSVENLVVELFEKHKLMPSFYKIKNQKNIDVRIDNIDEVSFEVVSK